MSSLRARRPVQNTGYDPVLKALHWSIFGLVLAQFIIGLTRLEGLGSFDNLHGTLGVVLLLLVVVRIAWRTQATVPARSSEMGPTEQTMAAAVELTLYAMLLVKPISGLLLLSAAGQPFDFAGVWTAPSLWPQNRDAEDIFGTLHFVSGVVLLAAMFIHVRMALRNRLLPRMLP